MSRLEQLRMSILGSIMSTIRNKKTLALTINGTQLFHGVSYKLIHVLLSKEASERKHKRRDASHRGRWDTIGAINILVED
jgi:hypothetical protein